MSGKKQLNEEVINVENESDVENESVENEQVEDLGNDSDISEIESSDDDLEDYAENVEPLKPTELGVEGPESSNIQFYDSDDEEEEDEEFDKFNNNDIKHELISEHPEFISHNTKEVNALATIIKDSNGIIIDELHRTVPFITRYERAKILGERSKQLSYSNVEPMISVPNDVIDCYEIAKLEYNANAIPFIIKRSLPDGTCEYWRFKDLEKILFD